MLSFTQRVIEVCLPSKTILDFKSQQSLGYGAIKIIILLVIKDLQNALYFKDNTKHSIITRNYFA